MKKKLHERINTKIKKLQKLKIRDNSKDRYKLNILVTEYNLMLQLLNENDEIDINKFHSLLEKKKPHANELISKWVTNK